jgi:hypothetical protein
VSPLVFGRPNRATGWLACERCGTRYNRERFLCRPGDTCGDRPDPDGSACDGRLVRTKAK